MDFLQTLVDHVTNDTKTGMDAVEAAFHEWRATVDERTGLEAYISDEFLNKIELPRAERARIYAEYCQEKTRLYDMWRFAPNGQRAVALREWLALKLPDEVKDGIDNDRIYTKNVIR